MTAWRGILDERFLMHRLRATSIAAIACLLWHLRARRASGMRAAGGTSAVTGGDRRA